MPPPPLPIITGPTYPPAGRTGMDYAPAAVQYSADGGVGPPFIWSLSGGIPTGLVIDAATGKLSGVITAACGTYTFNVDVVDGLSNTGTMFVVMFVSSLPNGLDVLKRLPNQDSKTCTVDNLNAIADAALMMIAGWTGCPIEPGTCGAPLFTDEVIPTKSFTQRAMQTHHPLVAIVSAMNNTTPLLVGSMKDVQLGNAQIAIHPSKDYLWLGSVPRTDGLGMLFVTYNAGFAILPPDLYEVFIYLTGLMYRERDRVGLESLAVGESTTKYFRDLPWPQQTTINNYRRVGLYV